MLAAVATPQSNRQRLGIRLRPHFIEMHEVRLTEELDLLAESGSPYQFVDRPQEPHPTTHLRGDFRSHVETIGKFPTNTVTTDRCASTRLRDGDCCEVHSFDRQSSDPPPSTFTTSGRHHCAPQ